MIDVLIEPPIAKYTFSDFDKIPEIMEVGYQSAKQQQATLNRLIKEKCKPYPAFAFATFNIEGILTNGEKSNDDYLEDLSLDQVRGVQSWLSLQDSLERLYQSGQFRKISFQLKPSSQGTILDINYQRLPVLEKIVIQGNTLV